VQLLSNAILLETCIGITLSYIHVCGTGYVGLCTHEVASMQRVEELLKGHLRMHVLYPFRADDLHHCQHEQRLGVPLMGDPPSCLSVWRAGTDCEEGLHY